MRRLVLTTASVLALAIGGAGVGFAADASHTTTNTAPNLPPASGTSQYAPNAGADMPGVSGLPQINRSEVRQAQEQLRDQGLYHGKIDGALGPETKQALQQFQQKNGLPVTATLDQQTMDKLLGNTGPGQGSSMPQRANQGIGSRANQPAGSNLGTPDH